MGIGNRTFYPVFRLYINLIPFRQEKVVQLEEKEAEQVSCIRFSHCA
jgi:hypothetical protein